MKVNRRVALKVMTAGAAMAAGGTKVMAREPLAVSPDAMGMLYDTTRCIGCKACVTACYQANGLEPDRDAEGLHQAPVDLNGRTKNIIKLYKDGMRTSFFKYQCMHCVDPACAASCMLHSLQKDPVTGIVTYDPSYCVGCRYCQMSCPYNVVKFEFDKAVPKIVKCEFCRHRQAEGATLAQIGGLSHYPAGMGPACCEVCPRSAVVYGKRTELLQEAKRRIAENPGMYYQDRVYGESEAGGTQVLYLSHVPFDRLGLHGFSDSGVPQVAYTVQMGLYRGFIAPLALYGVLAVAVARNRKAAKATEEKRS
jgi:Fe-S-cluster-containing dehydrogenase component